MDNSLLSIIGMFISIIGVIVALITGILSYKNIKKADSNGEFKDYLQRPLTNSDNSIKDAVQYLKIVNSSREVDSNDSL